MSSKKGSESRRRRGDRDRGRRRSRKNIVEESPERPAPEPVAPPPQREQQHVSSSVEAATFVA